MSWWDSESGSNWHCIVSGGYVVLGFRGSNISSFLTDSHSQSVPIEEFANGALNTEIKLQIGEKAFQEILDKVNALIEKKNRAPSTTPSGIS